MPLTDLPQHDARTTVPKLRFFKKFVINILIIKIHYFRFIINFLNVINISIINALFRFIVNFLNVINMSIIKKH